MAAIPGWAWASLDQFTQDGEPFAACPRRFLRRVVERLDALGLRAGAAYEFEFSVGRRPARQLRAGAPGSRVTAVSRSSRTTVHVDLIQAVKQGLICSSSTRNTPRGRSTIDRAPRPSRPPTSPILVRETVRAVGSGTDGWSVRSAVLRATRETECICTSVCGTGIATSWRAETGRPGWRGRRIRSWRGSWTRCRHSSQSLHRAAWLPRCCRSMVGRDALLGHGEPGGVAPVHRGHDPGERRLGQHGE